MKTILQYADPRATQRRWGPFFFFPSIRSILLVIVLVGSFFWLRVRHEPWVLVNWVDLPEGNDRFSHAPQFAFTPDNHLLVAGRDRKVAVYDSTGRKMRNISTDPGYSAFLRNGTQVLLIREGEIEGTIVNTMDGSIIQRTANPFLKGHNIEWCNDDASRVLTHYSLLGIKKSAIWDLTRGEPTPTIKPIFEDSALIYPPADPDGTYLLGTQGILRLKDLTIARPMLSAARSVGYIEWVGCVGPYEVLFMSIRDGAGQPADKRLEVRTIQDNKRVLSVPFDTIRSRSGYASTRLTLSKDGTLLAIQQSDFSQALLDVFDLRKGIQIGRRGKGQWGTPCFIPGTRQFVIDSSKQPCIFEDPASDPLFLLTSPPAMALPSRFRSSRYYSISTPTTTLLHYKLVSVDGTLLVGATNSEFSLWKRPGPECRLTQFGILGMPHAWLFTATGIGVMFSLILDARRRSTVRIVPLWISLPAGVLVAAVSIYMLLSLILGRRDLTPAPILIVAIIALSLGSKFWRWTSLVLLAAAILWYANSLRLYFQRGPAAPGRFLDSFYMTPRLLSLIILASSAAITLLLLLTMLLRRPQYSSRPQVLQ